MKDWNNLPLELQCDEVRKYYNILSAKRGQLVLKRIFDIGMGIGVLAVTAIPMAVIAFLISKDSSGGVFFRQERITQYGRIFRIHKFRTMVVNADQIGASVTVSGDSRVTNIGRVLRRYRLDELPQVFDVLSGDMSFVGTRPEVKKYVDSYTNEMKATLLMPAGITSEASILFKDENQLLDCAENVDQVYLNKVLPEKMKYNLQSMENYSLVNDFKVLKDTFVRVFFK